MKSDITLTFMGKTLIINTKFYSKTMQTNKLFNSKTLHSSNLYQIYTYVKNNDVNNTGDVSGVILYAKTDEDITPDNHYVMDRNRIHVKTLDLNKKFDGIRLQLDKIISEWLH